MPRKWGRGSKKKVSQKGPSGTPRHETARTPGVVLSIDYIEKGSHRNGLLPRSQVNPRVIGRDNKIRRIPPGPGLVFKSSPRLVLPSSGWQAGCCGANAKRREIRPAQCRGTRRRRRRRRVSRDIISRTRGFRSSGKCFSALSGYLMDESTCCGRCCCR